jgi:tetratricopeptide (TPR) repeat protein
MNKPKVVKKNKAPNQNFVFKLITVIIPILILLVFEGILRITGYGDNLNLFIQNPIEGYEKYMMVNPEVGKKYFQKFEYTAPANDIFLTEKPENTFRIFVMGSSTVFGFPYERNLMFSRILHQQLEDAYPGKKIEVVNTAITAINSFTLLDFTDQILKYKPNTILIYAGHNEFYGAFGIGSNETMSKNRGLTRLHIALMNLKTYQIIRNIISGVSRKIAASSKEEVHGTLMKRMVANKDILLGSEEYNIAMERYKQNMGDILKKAGKKNVPVFFSELVCNINGMEPFNSIATDKLEGAAEVYKKAQTAEKSGDFDTALNLYYKAKDLDCIRFRASEDVNRIVNELVEEFKVYRVPMLSVFQNNSPNKLIGNNLMTEHVHPNIDGNFLMADAFFTEIVKSGVIGVKNEENAYSYAYRKLNYGYTPLDSIAAHHRIQTLKGNWPFVKMGETEVNYLLQHRPTSYLDSLSFSAIKNKKLTLSEVRLDLAQRYQKTGQIFLAFKEYQALIRTNPNIAVNYRDAATCLIQLTDLPLALKYYQKSLDYEESGFALFKIGEIYFFMGDYNNAIINFERAFPLIADDKKLIVLVKSYIACVYGNQKEKAKAAATELKRVKAEKYLLVPPKTYTYTQYIPFQTREQVEKAKNLILGNKPDEALTVLESSLQIYDSHIANRMIGEIYLAKQNSERALSYFRKVYNQFKFDPEFLYNFALVYLARNDNDNARKCADEIKTLNPEYEKLPHLNSLLSSTN